MSTLVQSLSDFIKLIAQAFNLSSTFPALVFVMLVRGFVLPNLPETSVLRIDRIPDTETRISIIVISVALLAYLLDAANLSIIRLFEGYPLLSQFPFNWLRKRNQDFVKENVRMIQELRRCTSKLLKEISENDRTDLIPLAKRLIRRRRELESQMVGKYPEDSNYVLPTSFGNVIAAAERYSHKLFGMDSVVLWPFLIPTLVEENYSQFIVREKAVMDFLINLTVVLAVFGCLLGAVEWFTGDWGLTSAIKLALVGFACALTYLLAIQAAANWGFTVRSAFVIFRDDLRKTLHLRSPWSYDDEVKLWEMASNFFRANAFKEQQTTWGREIFLFPYPKRASPNTEV